jgi:CspA family cold shock protein
MKGKVKKLIWDRGFGFISTEDEKEIFFHRSALEGIEFDALGEGTDVEFDVEDGPKGPRAVKIRVIE